MTNIFIEPAERIRLLAEAESGASSVLLNPTPILEWRRVEQVPRIVPTLDLRGAEILARVIPTLDGRGVEFVPRVTHTLNWSCCGFCVRLGVSAQRTI